MGLEVSDNIFRQYDIRGRYGTELTDEFAEALGVGYANILRAKSSKGNASKKLKVSIGRDVRLSSSALRDSLIKGLTKSGIDCIDLGECPTPLQYFSLHTLEVDGGVMITGSHNPSDYNGFKVSVGKETIHGEEIQELKDFIKESLDGERTISAGTGEVEELDIISSYIDYHAERFSKTISARPKEPIKVVIDAGNGAGGLGAPALLRKLGCDVIELFCDPDGNFPNHHPDPTVEKNLTALIDQVKKQKADFGIGYDGDADRIGVVDEKGGIIWGDQLMVIFARDIITVQPGATIVGEVKCSQVMYDEIERLGGKAVMWKTGHSLIKSRMKELHAAMAGEMSGHIFFADRYFGFDDALYASCRLVEILAYRREEEPGLKFSALLKGLPKTKVTPEMRINCPDEEKFEIIERLKRAIAESSGEPKIRNIIDIDGLRVVFENGWALVRASNTQPEMVLRFEAKSDKQLEKYKAFTKKMMNEVWPEGELNL